MCLIPNLSNTEWNECQVCAEAKHPKKLFNKSMNTQIALLEFKHSDLGDLKNTMSSSCKRYYINKEKVEIQLDKMIKRLRFD